MALVSLYCEEAMRKDEQFKVKGCRIARPRGRDVKRRSASMRLRVFFSGTPALINMERSGMLINEWAMPRTIATINFSNLATLLNRYDSMPASQLDSIWIAMLCGFHIVYSKY